MCSWHFHSCLSRLLVLSYIFSFCWFCWGLVVKFSTVLASRIWQWYLSSAFTEELCCFGYSLFYYITSLTGCLWHVCPLSTLMHFDLSVYRCRHVHKSCGPDSSQWVSGYHMRLLLLALAPSRLPGWSPIPAARDCKHASSFSLKLLTEIPELTLSCPNVRLLHNKTDDVPEIIRDRRVDVFCLTFTTLSDTDSAVVFAFAA